MMESPRACRFALAYERETASLISLLLILSEFRPTMQFSPLPPVGVTER
jgi:hypothetical protein